MHLFVFFTFLFYSQKQYIVAFIWYQTNLLHVFLRKQKQQAHTQKNRLVHLKSEARPAGMQQNRTATSRWLSPEMGNYEPLWLLCTYVSMCVLDPWKVIAAEKGRKSFLWNRCFTVTVFWLAFSRFFSSFRTQGSRFCCTLSFVHFISFYFFFFTFFYFRLEFACRSQIIIAQTHTLWACFFGFWFHLKWKMICRCENWIRWVKYMAVANGLVCLSVENDLIGI